MYRLAPSTMFWPRILRTRLACIDVLADNGEAPRSAVSLEVTKLHIAALVPRAYTGVYCDTHIIYLQRKQPERLEMHCFPPVLEFAMRD
jgi:hypothetical protein